MLLIPILASAALGAATGSAQLPELRHCVFGEAYAFADANCTAHIVNSSDAPLHLIISPTLEGDSVEQSDVIVPAHGEVAVALNLAIGNRAGKLKRYFRVQAANDQGAKEYLEATGFVMTALDAPRPNVDFGSVATNSAENIEKTLTLDSHDTASFRIERVLERPAAVDAEIAPGHKTLRVRLRPDAPWGVLDGVIKLAIDTPHQKQAWIGVHGKLHGDVVPDANPVSLGILPAHREQLLKLTELHRTDGKKFAVGNPRLEGMKGEAELVDCAPKARGCKTLRLKVSDAQPAGMVRGKIFVPLPDLRRDLAIDVEGFFQTDQAAQGTSGDGAKGGHARMVEVPTSPEESPEESKASAKPPVFPELPPPGAGPLLKWSVLDERVVYGYQVFRADAEQGPFVLLNVPAIAAKSSSKAGAAYQWRDTSAVKGRTYWYYVGVVYNDGRKERVTPEIKAIAK